MKKDRGAFESETFHRMLVEAARYWLIEFFLRRKKLPEREVRYVYANGPNGIGWGNAPGPDDPDMKPLRGKRIRVTIEIEDWP
jgi:hypothetical protein